MGSRFEPAGCHYPDHWVATTLVLGMIPVVSLDGARYRKACCAVHHGSKRAIRCSVRHGDHRARGVHVSGDSPATFLDNPTFSVAILIVMVLAGVASLPMALQFSLLPQFPPDWCVYP